MRFFKEVIFANISSDDVLFYKITSFAYYFQRVAVIILYTRE